MSRYSYTDRDETAIRWQLESDNVNIAGVVERCNYGYPRIMLMHHGKNPAEGAAMNYGALSNLIWLTCPFLNEKIHRLEDRGFIEKISEFVNNDQDLSSLMIRAHAHFYYFRKAVFNRYVGPVMPLDKMKPVNSGIGGTADVNKLKCLHAHFAYSRICRHDVAGYITSYLLGFKYNCDDGRCRNAH